MTSPASSPSEAGVPGDAADPTVSHVVEHLFRQEAGKMVTLLTRIFGVEHLGLAEDVVQETLARALQTWPYHGIPDKPAAWIMRAARNLALDVVRRQKVFRDKEPEIIRLMDRASAAPDASAALDDEVTDDRLRLMFVCCHPEIPQDDQAALALKTLCGFGVTEISRAFLTTEAAIAKRLTRAKQRIRDAQIPFEIPAGAQLAPRLEGVLRSLYLLFNEGYKASTGNQLIREDICLEAIRLAELLAQHRSGDLPKTHALLALMLFSTARLPARVDDQGNLLRLQDQDRSRWSQPLIARGMYHLARSASGLEASEYHLQAGIAACHCAAARFEDTPWRQVLGLYDKLVLIDPSPVVALNRAVVVGHVFGPAAGLAAVADIQDRRTLESYYLLHAVLGEFECLLGHAGNAVDHFQRALQLVDLDSERRFLQQRLSSCATGAGR